MGLQNPVWWRKVHWLRPHLRHHGLRQEVRAQIQAAEAGCDRGQDQGQPQAEEGEKEQDQEGARYRQGQGRPSWKEGEKSCYVNSPALARPRTHNSLLSKVPGLARPTLPCGLSSRWNFCFSVNKWKNPKKKKKKVLALIPLL